MKSRTLLLFYILVVYVLIQFAWWAYMLVELNTETAGYRIELLDLPTSVNDDASAAQIKVEESRLHKRKMMIASEGMVFLSLLIFGITKIRSSFIKEVDLARQQKNFLLSITHEFKSPLAAVKLNLQTLQRRQLEPEQKNELLRRSISETDRIHVLVENALMAARLEGHNSDLHMESIDLSSFLTDLVEGFRGRQTNHHRLSLNIEPQVFVKGDQLALSSAINNLLENAEKYSPAGSTISISLLAAKEEAVLCVADEGNGIPEQERKRIFEKFYRIGNEDTRKTRGTGLGLFIVSHIASIHNGKILVKEHLPTGSIFELRLPLA